MNVNPTDCGALGMATTSTRGTRIDLVILLAILALAVGVYANALHGEFVYDDTKQIVNNPLIQQPKLFRQAIFSIDDI